MGRSHQETKNAYCPICNKRIILTSRSRLSFEKRQEKYLRALRDHRYSTVFPCTDPRELDDWLRRFEARGLSQNR